MSAGLPLRKLQLNTSTPGHAKCGPALITSTKPTATRAYTFGEGVAGAPAERASDN
ncbi:hypothetical protein M409DRAFT_31209 [Zasmidium cellare ATCC 36951]|uniref:Uncharacterized protein n=1 Tax=Zasmidium cellare ATCC 36951 TaxID=1080233 RepID=A0A6A6BW76_ZASCE|nr:uncharacterized protein M409DRAFT_31209 [Zasmidium cellare ATCC 36951]KAF2158288.1 hypothetical protein M409DRAFT_31209 [Zasmidium cellare ATCC 36951]